MANAYHVYLSIDDSQPEGSGDDEHTDWISFTCKSISLKFINKNTIERLPQHTSVKIPLGEMIFSATLNGCLFTRMDTSAAGSTSWNKFVAFVARHALSDGATIYLWVEMAMGEDASKTYMQFFNDDADDLEDYMQCQIQQFRVTVDATTQVGTGVIQLTEEWSS